MMSNGSRILYRKLVQRTSQAVTSATGKVLSHEEGPTLQEVKGMIFDMDGTLTIPVLNFLEMKARLGLAPGQDILPMVQRFPPEERARAMAVIEEFEEQGVRNMKLQPGVLDLMHFLAERGVVRALMTRNSTKAAEAFLSRLKEELTSHLHCYPALREQEVFSQVITRDYEPCKPHPAGALHVCKQWGLVPGQVVIVGDDMTDMLCGLRASTAFNILLRNNRNVTQKDYSNFVVTSLPEIVTLLSSSPLDVIPKCEEDAVVPAT